MARRVDISRFTSRVVAIFVGLYHSVIRFFRNVHRTDRNEIHIEPPVGVCHPIDVQHIDNQQTENVATVEVIPSMETIKETPFEIFDLRRTLIEKTLTEDTRIFLEDRLEGLVIDHEMDDDQIITWGLSAASFVDETKLLLLHIPEDDKIAVESVLAALWQKIEELKLALVDDDEWNPSRQRAVSVTRVDTASVTRILKKRTCGLMFKGAIIKKQEVEVEMPLTK